MKKIFKSFCFISFILVASLVGVACSCSEPKLSSIELSILDSYAVFVGGNKGYVVEKKDNDTPIIPISVTMNPDSFSKEDLTWSSTFTDVATVNNRGVVTCRWLGVEDKTTTITATYNKGDNQKSTSILLTVTSKQLPKFENKTATITYAGRDLKDNFKVTNGEEYASGFSYHYFDLESGLEVNEILSCGRYRIIFSSDADNLEYARMTVEVTPYILNLTAKSGTSTYGKTLENGFYNSYDDETISNYGENILGGVGVDAGASLGKMIYVTNATMSSRVGGDYYTDIAFKLDNKNYTLLTTRASYVITKRAVVILVESQTNLTYGDKAVEKMFVLYDYDEYKANNDSLTGLQPLDNSIINYKNDVTAPASYDYTQNGQPKTVNKYGFLDAGSYDIGYTSVGVGANLAEITVILPGRLVISKKQAIVAPHNLKKSYGTDDISITYNTNDILKKDEIVDFLYVDYKSSVYVGSEFDLGINNRKAPAGVYNYAIDNLKNKNYTFELDERAQPTYSDTATRLAFTVEKCEIVLNFADQEFDYAKPQNDADHIVSYYHNPLADYVVTLSSITVSGEEIKDFKGEKFDTYGAILLPSGDEFSFEIKLLDNPHSTHYVGYFATLDKTRISFTNGSIDNYDISFSDFKVNLNKVVITITPNATERESFKIYDAIAGTDSAISNFLSKFVLSNGEDISTILNIDSEVLSLKDKEDKYYFTGDDNIERKVDKIKDAGKYRVLLSPNMSFLQGKEYVDFKLDDSKFYYFTIEKMDIIIRPDKDQSKVYCDTEPTLLYTEDSSTPVPSSEDSLVKTGALLREEGENVGRYQISLGTLSYGSNYSLILNETKEYFEITTRKVTVKPYSYTVTYGDRKQQNIAYNSYVEGSYDENLFVKPTFSGEFKLQFNGADISKINGLYPVTLDTKGVALPYTISQGTFGLSNTNYELIFDETATYMVEQRELNIDLVATLYEDKTKEPETGVLLNYASATPLADSAEKLEIKAKEYTKGTDTYYIEDISKLDISLTYNGIDIKSCYKITLGQNVVYTIDKEIIDFRITLLNDPLSRSVETTFDGTSKENLFTLTIATKDYYFASDEDGNSSKYSLVFTNSSVKTSTPTNVGSFTVGVELLTGDQIVVKHKDSDAPIVFTDFNIVENNYVATLSQKGFLTINKAQITVDESLLAFENDIKFSDTLDNLPNILTTNDGKNVFSGVNGTIITLKEFDGGRNYEFRHAPTSIEMLSANDTHLITVTVEVAGGDGENYEPLTIDVPLKVLPKEVTLSNRDVALNCGQGEDLTYDGTAKSFKLFIDSDLPNYHIEYSYVKLQVIYEKSIVGKIQKFVYDGTTIKPVMNGDEIVYSTIEDLGRTNELPIERVNYNAREYIVLDTGSSTLDAYLTSDATTTQNAGLYICVANIVADKNYTLKFEGGSKTFRQVKYSRFFEIKRSENVEITNWKQDFYYETVFNVTLPETLPFEFAMNPDYKEDVIFSTSQEDTWAEKNYMLDVGNYTINVTIDEENCYFTTELAFNVVAREAKVFFPEGDNSYEYQVVDGKEVVIDSFLRGVYATFIKGGAENKVNYIDDSEKRFTFTFYSVADEDNALPSAPSAIGEYFVIGTYDSDNFYGSTRYDYKITKKRYTGVINATDRLVDYNPEYTASQLKSIIQSMLICDMSLVQEVQIRDVLADRILDFNTEDWVGEFVDCASPKKIKFIIIFKDPTIANREDVGAELTFKKINITSDLLSPKDNDASYTYSGNAVYKELTFRGVSLAPNKKGGTEETILDGQYTIIYGKKKGTEYDTSYVTVNDRLGNLIFVLKYNYYVESASGEFELMEGIFPISPNVVQVDGESVIKSYKVEYFIESSGANYLTSVSLKEGLFTIAKTTDLGIFVKNYTTTYTGNDLSRLFNESLIEVTNSLNNAVNFRLFKKSKDLSTGIYNENNGICLVYSITKDGSEMIRIEDAGEYKIRVALMYFSTFKPQNYFGSLNLNGTKYTAEQIVERGADTDVTYAVGVEVKFVVDKAPFPYTLSNVEEFATGTNFHIAQREIDGGTKTIVEIAKDGTFALNEDASKDFKLSFSKGSSSFSSVSDLVVEEGAEYTDFYFDLTCTSGNFQSSERFIIRKYADALPKN